MKKTGGQAVVAGLQAHDVKPVFGMPGVHNLALYDALCDAPEMRHVVRHEQGAGFAADGYANRRTSSGSAASAMNSADSSTYSIALDGFWPPHVVNPEVRAGTRFPFTDSQQVYATDA